MPESNRSPGWRRYLRFWGTNVRHDVDAELGFHLDARADELVAAGVSPEEARLTAMREFGDVGQVRRLVRALDEEHARRRRIHEWWGDAWGDVRYAVRSLRRAPGFVLVVVGTLTLGIGLNGTIFSLVNAYLLRPLPLPRAERFVVMGSIDPGIGIPAEMSYPDYQDYRSLEVFSDLAATVSTTASLNEAGRAERVWTEQTTGNYFQTLRPPMLLGRGYTDDESTRGMRVVVLSYEYWRRKFASDSTIVGRSIRLDGIAHVVLGVTAPGFRGYAPMISSDGWTPLDEAPGARAAHLSRRSDGFLNIIGVLAPGVTIGHARSAVAARAAQIRRDHPETSKNIEAIVVPETRARPLLAIAQPVPLISLVLMTLTLLVLVIACVNVANLLLARGTVHQREHAIRSALGASRWRLARQALTEVGLLSLAGGLGAFLLARWAASRMSGVRVATDAPVSFEFPTDWRVFVFTLLAALVTTVLAGLLPALRNANAPPQSVLSGGGRAITDRRQNRVRSVLVIGQIAVSVLVLVAAGLFARSMRAAQSMELGFRTRGVLTAAFDVSMARYDSVRRRSFQRELLDRVQKIPGVDGAALAARIPFGYSNNTWRVATTERQGELPESGLSIFDNIVTPDYFRVVGPPLARGRTFTADDIMSAPLVAVVNEAMARRLWPAADAIGKTFRTLENGAVYRVVGVARDAKYMFLGESPRPFFWRPLSQTNRDALFIEMATTGDPNALEQPLRAIARGLDPDLPLYDMRTMDEHLRNGRAMFAVRLGAMFGGAFALLALSLAAVGVYGVVSYSVSHRTREIGIRIALGARVANVMRLVVGQGLALAAAGVVVGAALAFAVTRVMATLLYGVRPNDPIAFGGAMVVLAAITAIASWLPARRAARLNPVRALRAE